MYRAAEKVNPGDRIVTKYGVAHVMNVTRDNLLNVTIETSRGTFTCHGATPVEIRKG